MATLNFQQQLLTLIKTGEGSVSHMYLDTVAKVTVGVGNLLPDVVSAQALPFLQRDNNDPASPQQIEEDFHRVAEQQAGKLASSYQKYTRLYLPEEDINSLLSRRIADFEAALAVDFMGYSQYPETAQKALMDMVFNLGNRGLIEKFPSLTRAVREQNWEKCAKQCHRRGISEARNDEVYALFMAAARV